MHCTSESSVTIELGHNAGENPILRYQATGVLNEIPQDSETLRPQPDLANLTRQRPTTHIERDWSKRIAPFEGRSTESPEARFCIGPSSRISRHFSCVFRRSLVTSKRDDLSLIEGAKKSAMPRCRRAACAV